MLRTNVGAALTLLGCIAVAAGATAQQRIPLDVTGATRVEFDDSAGVWELRGNPVTVRRGFVVVRAPTIRYDARDQIVIASSGVSYRDKILVAFAGTVTVWVQEQRVVAESDVQVTYQDGEPVDLRAARVELLQSQRQLIASGAVRLVRGLSAVTADQIAYDHAAGQAVASGSAQVQTPDGVLRADRIEAMLAAEELTADGQVIATTDDLEGRADHAVFRQRPGLLELSGDAVVRLGRNTIRSSAMTVDLRARRVIAAGRAHLVGYPAAP